MSSSQTLFPSRRLAVILAMEVILLTARPNLRAESGITYKYADYREDDDRIAVKTQSALVQQDFGADNSLRLEGTVDAIAGATPNGQPAPDGSNQVVLVPLHDRRKAWDGTFTHQFKDFSLALGVADSRESDYTSVGWSVNTLTYFNQKNTTLLAGIGGNDDDVKVFFQDPWAKKRNHDFVLGVTQLLDPRTSVTFNVTWGRTTGYLSDQYKLVQKNFEVAPGVFLHRTYGENRPPSREKAILFASINHAFPDANAALEGSYRFYHDTFGTDAHMIEARWLQKLGAQFLLVPTLRAYQQGAADFYHYSLENTPIQPQSGPPPVQGPFYSSDYRLSSFRSYTTGLQLVWTPVARFSLDASVDRYEMHGRDGVTPQSAYARATIVTGGVRFSW